MANSCDSNSFLAYANDNLKNVHRCAGIRELTSDSSQPGTKTQFEFQHAPPLFLTQT